MIGRTLLHYEVGAELGAGAMGRVYLARDMHTGRRVALKLLGPESRGPAARERLKREAGAAARLSHPGIVTLFALEEAEGELFLVQELVEGETLAARLAHGPLGPVEVLRLARELTSALAHAHAHGVVHRDLKPDNILVAPDGSYKIADFGIARVEGMPTTTIDGTFVGTLPFVAPERLRGHRGDARVDLFALGAILHEAISGRRAFPGLTEAEVCYAVMNEEPKPIEAPSAALEPLVLLSRQLLAKEPSLRPASAESVATLVDEMALQTVPRRASGRAVPRWAIAAALAAVTLATLALWRPWEARRARSPEAPGLLVMPFENVTDPLDRDRLGAVVSYLFVTSLAQGHTVSVVSSERVLDILNEMGYAGAVSERRHARAVARRAHVGRIVTGSILRVDPMVVTAELSDVSRGRVLHAVRAEGLPGQSVYEIVDRLCDEISQTLVGTTPSPVPPGNAPGGSRDLDASRRYVEGLGSLARGELQKADLAFTSALDLDPGFEQARYQLALVHWLQAGRTLRESP
jgi:eukaryotic-like serine/threonine-protein kinase